MEKNNIEKTPFRKGSRGQGYKAEQKRLRGDIDKTFGDFRKMDVSQNLWADAQDFMQDVSYEDPTEDLTVNQQQAQFQKEMALQQQANLQDATAGSGMFNAQQMANQMQEVNQQISADIGEQENRIQMAQVEGSKWMQEKEELKAQSAMDTQKIKLQGEADAMDRTLQKKQGELAFLSGMMQSSEANEAADFRKGQNTWFGGSKRSRNRDN